MTAGIERLMAEKYVLITTYRKDGTPVATPVWAAPYHGELAVWTERKSGKVKRIRRDGTVRLQACDVRGRKTHGPEFTGHARVLDDADITPVRRALERKYGFVARVALLYSRLRPPKGRNTCLAIRVDEP
ncbi:PPOX class F420-dependent oxidoreductase [Amycolatopsis sacchari]|uniref:PPOX class F420-dependent oxidoreductase n=1 Tax=Amycolatopsis sacchari TaxID=115433 RepID=UPI003D70E8F3